MRISLEPSLKGVTVENSFGQKIFLTQDEMRELLATSRFYGEVFNFEALPERSHPAYPELDSAFDIEKLAENEIESARSTGPTKDSGVIYQDLVFKFAFSTNGKESASKSKVRYDYYHFSKDDSYVVERCNSKYGTTLDTIFLGSLNNPESKISQVIFTINRFDADDAFSKRQIALMIKDQIKDKWWLDSRRLRCAFDILVNREIILRFTEPPSKPIYYVKNAESQFWHDITRLENPRLYR